MNINPSQVKTKTQRNTEGGIAALLLGGIAIASIGSIWLIGLLWGWKGLALGTIAVGLLSFLTGITIVTVGTWRELREKGRIHRQSHPPR